MGQEVLLFHSALGLRPAVREFADRLRADGHTLHTPDSFERGVREPRGRYKQARRDWDPGAHRTRAVHYAQGDPPVEVDQVRALEAAARASAKLMLERVLGFLGKLEIEPETIE
jgi:hypothetical protein